MSDTDEARKRAAAAARQNKPMPIKHSDTDAVKKAAAASWTDANKKK